MPAQNNSQNNLSVEVTAAIDTSKRLNLSPAVSSVDNRSNLGNAKLQVLGLTPGDGSYASRAFPAVDIPDPGGLALEFIYNYFTPDERVKQNLSKEEQIVNLKSSESAQVLYELTAQKRPRIVRLRYTPAQFLTNDNNLRLEGASILDNLDKIFVEGATSSKYFSGTELVDTLADRQFYSFAELTNFIQNDSLPEDSPNSLAHLLADKIASGSLQGQQKSLILNTMSKLQPSGYSYASSDVRREQVEAAYDSAARQSFSLKFNNLFFSDLIVSANRQAASVFEDEMRAYTQAPSVAGELQETAIRDVDPTRVFEDEYEFYGTPISSEKLSESSGITEIGNPPKFAVTGYIVQRFEVLENGALEKLEPLIIEDPTQNFVIDSNVRYGGTYIYKIRTVAIVETIAKRLKRKRLGGQIIEYVRAKFLLASEGLSGTVECVERVPPPPPDDIDFRFDYNHRKPVVQWTFPMNPTRDIARFQVFKRNSINEPFKLEVEYDFDSSIIKSNPLEQGPGKRIVKMKFPRTSYVDKNYVDGSSPIYAVAAIDAHGMTSNYSEQFRVTYDKSKNKIVKKLVSKSGAPKPYPNMYLNQDTFQDLMKVSGKDRMQVVFDPEYYVVTQTRSAPSGRTVEDDLNLIGIDPSNPTYKIQIINTDLQQSELINIKIGDLTSPPLAIPAAKLSKNNLSFEFGIKVD